MSWNKITVRRMIQTVRSGIQKDRPIVLLCDPSDQLFLLPEALLDQLSSGSLTSHNSWISEPVHYLYETDLGRKELTGLQERMTRAIIERQPILLTTRDSAVAQSLEALGFERHDLRGMSPELGRLFHRELGLRIDTLESSQKHLIAERFENLFELKHARLCSFAEWRAEVELPVYQHRLMFHRLLFLVLRAPVSVSRLGELAALESLSVSVQRTKQFQATEQILYLVYLFLKRA